MRLEIEIPEHHYNNIVSIDSINLGRVPYKGIIMYTINAIKHGKVLEQEPTIKNDLGVDCIDRKMALDTMQMKWKKCSSGDDAMQESIDAIREMPSVTPQEPRWIPVSERLPNLDDYSGSSVWQKKVLITGYLSFDDTKELFVSEAFAEDVMHNSVHDTVVTAWMPLPTPYEPQESEDKK